MASFKGVQAVLTVIEEFFKARLPSELSDGPTNARVNLLGSNDLANRLNGNLLGIYLYRLTIDDHGRSRFFKPQGTNNGGSQPELPINLHFLLIAHAGSATTEADLLSWAMVELANNSQLDISHLQTGDDEWGQTETINITPVDLTTEDLMRIWDGFETPYTIAMAYVAKTIRLRLNRQRTEGPDVVSRVLPVGRVP